MVFASKKKAGPADPTARKRAREIYVASSCKATSREIAAQLAFENVGQIDDAKIRVWKQRDGWPKRGGRDNVRKLAEATDIVIAERMTTIVPADTVERIEVTLQAIVGTMLQLSSRIQERVFNMQIDTLADALAAAKTVAILGDTTGRLDQALNGARNRAASGLAEFGRALQGEIMAPAREPEPEDDPAERPADLGSIIAKYRSVRG